LQILIPDELVGNGYPYALVMEIALSHYKEALEQRGYRMGGKYKQYKQNISESCHDAILTLCRWDSVVIDASPCCVSLR
jgi:hypothetical protein